MRATILLLATLLVVAGAEAGTSAWSCLDGGVFDDIACWTDDIVPGEFDTALFDVGGSYDVSFVAPPDPPLTFHVDRFIVRTGFVTLDHAPGGRFTLGLTSGSGMPTIVGESGPANCVVTSLLNLQSTPQAYHGGLSIGHNAGALGVMEFISSQGLLFVAVSAKRTITVGAEGTGFLCFDAGDTPTFVTGSASFVVGDATGAAGTMLLSGSLQVNGDLGGSPLIVGRGGFGQLLVEDGANIDGAGGAFGEQPGSFAAVTASGGGRVTLLGGLVVGNLGHAFVDLLDGGELEASTGGIVLGQGMNATQQGVGVLRVIGMSSTATTYDGSLFIGQAGSGTLVLSRGGAMTIDGDVVRGPFADNEIHVELGTSGDYPDAALSCTGMTDDLSVRVALADGFFPSGGDVFRLFDAGLILGEVTFEALPALPAPLEWLVLRDAQSLELRVGPVPGDANGDGVVDVDDLVVVISAWGVCRVPPGGCDGDLNGDGVVNVNDLVLVVENWG